MASLTTGIVENSPVAGVRPSVRLAVKITNDDSVGVSIQILGYYVSGTLKILYVSELFSMNPGEVANRSYFADFDAFEFQFVTSSPMVEISAWGKNAAGALVAAQRVLPAELNSLIPPANPSPTPVNRIYIANQGSNNVSVIDGNTNTVTATIPVGTQPSGIAVNPLTRRIYVANLADNNVSVIEDDPVIATIPVGTAPRAVAVNSRLNRVYVANRDTNNLSVIDGRFNNVIATVEVGTQPKSVAVNQITDRVYVANEGSGDVSVRWKQQYCHSNSSGGSFTIRCRCKYPKQWYIFGKLHQ